MRRRRRNAGTWLPNVGSATGIGAETTAGRSFAIQAAANGAITTGILPLTLDTPFEGDVIAAGVDSLADVIGSEYVLKRIVGNVFLNYANDTFDQEEVAGQPLIAAAGFFVARANDAAVGGGEDTPIGSATEGERRDNYSPLENDTIREPWIWRRTWILGAQGGRSGQIDQFVPNPNMQAYPISTVGYGTAAGGPYIDSRVKRIVANDNRLWFAISVANFPLGTAVLPGFEGSLVGFLDYRLFGSLRKARNQSAF